MASTRPSSAPLFTTLEDIYASYSYERETDLVLQKRGSNQNLTADANHHDGAPNLGPRSNRVQDGALARIHLTSPLGSPSKANPAGAQTS